MPHTTADGYTMIFVIAVAVLAVMFPIALWWDFRKYRREQKRLDKIERRQW